MLNFPPTLRRDYPNNSQPSPNAQSHDLNLFEFNDSLFRSRPVTTSLSRYDNVENRGFDLITSYDPSPKSLMLSIYMKVNPSSLPDLPTGIATSIDYQDSLQQLSPTVSSISYILASNTLMEFEMKRISIVSLSSSLDNLFSGLYEIHIVSRVNIVGVGTDLVRLAKSSFVTGISALFQTLLFGYINVNYDYLMLVRANVSRTQVKSIYGFIFLEQASPFNISILRIIVLFLVFILLSNVLPVVIFLPLSMAPSAVRVSP